MKSDPLDTIKRLGEIRECTKKATPGPWTLCSSHNGPHLNYNPTENLCSEVDINSSDYGEGSDQCRTNLEWIASARTYIPALLDLIGEMGRMLTDQHTMLVLVTSPHYHESSPCEPCRLIAALRETKP